MKVGTVLALETVPEVRSTGPKPMIPSTPLKPVAEEAAPIDCFVTVRPPKLTVSVYSVPENDPLPYETETVPPVEIPVVDFSHLAWAPHQVFEAKQDFRSTFGLESVLNGMD